jgi:hypothetical protein
VAVALVVVIVVAGVACALLARARGQAENRLAAETARARDLEGRLTEVSAERDELRSGHEWLSSANARLAADVEHQRGRADELAARLDAAGGDGVDDDGLWHLLLAHIARRWAAVAGVPPEGRAVSPGPPADQLAQALARETERLREEVGVDVELIASTAVEPAGLLGDRPADRLPVLLAAVELLGVLAASSQRVTVDVGEALVLVGEGWLDPSGELEAVRARALAAGVAVGALEVAGERVQVIVRSGAEVPGPAGMSTSGPA